MNVHFECWSLISVWAPKKQFRYTLYYSNFSWDQVWGTQDDQLKYTI